MEDLVSSVFDGLGGVWSIERRIEPGGRFEGRAVFRPDGDGRYCYEEHGEIVLANGSRHEAWRRYVYERDGDGIVVRFDDGPDRGKLFLRLSLRVGEGKSWPVEARDRHLCGDDVYDAAYRFVGPDRFEFRCRVEGPRKGYSLHSVFTRVDPGQRPPETGTIAPVT